MPNKNKQAPAAHPRHALRSRARCRGDGGILASAPANLPLPRVRGTFVSSLPTSSASILWKASIATIPDPGANSKLPINSTACFVRTCGVPQAKLAFHTILLRVGGTNCRLHILEPFKYLGLNSQNATDFCHLSSSWSGMGHC